jgi:hypothetical protein
MALQQTTVIDKIEILENGIIQVRKRTDIFDDLNPLVIMASNYHRDSLFPEQDINNQDFKVVAIANAVWTPEVIALYKSQQVQDISTTL